MPFAPHQDAAETPQVLLVAAPGESLGGRWKAVASEASLALPLAPDIARPARRKIWASRLDEIVAHAPGPLVIVAHGLGCLATAWWARLSPELYVSPVAGALLIAPPEDAGQGFGAPNTLLPFPSLVIGRRGDPAAQRLAQSWGSRYADAALERLVDAAPPRKPEAWQRGEAALDALVRRVQPRAGFLPQEVSEAALIGA